jgi:hypothetical protein
VDHYTTLKHWLKAKWRNIPDEQVAMMLQAANAIESLELEIHNLKRQRWLDAQDASESRMHHADQMARQ